MKVIFLDIDGVLNSGAYDRRRNWNELTDIDESRLPLVKQIVDQTGAVIVLSSTWREHWEKDIQKCDVEGAYITYTFAKYGLEIYDKTPFWDIRANRIDEVKRWLEGAKDVEKFVIRDDYGFGWADLSPRFIKTNPRFGLGLEENHVKKAIELLTEE